MTNTANILPNPDPTKWQDMHKEFSAGAINALPSSFGITCLSAVAGFVAIGSGNVGSGLVAIFSSGAGTVGAAMISSSALGTPVRERPTTRTLGSIFSLALPITALAVGTHVYDKTSANTHRPANNNTAALTAPAPASACGDAAVQREIGTLQKTSGIKLICQ